jgi:ribosome biogenesis GTPase
MRMQFSLKALGWNFFFEEQVSKEDLQEFAIARVAIEHKSHYLLYSELGELHAEVAGRLLYTSEVESDLPKVGDWVLIVPYDGNKAVIQTVLKRKTCLSRKVAGRSQEEQVIAANLDVLFIVQGLDDDFNINRLERYLSIVQEGIKPVILLNKADLCSDTETKTAAVKSRMPHIPVMSLCALDGPVNKIDPFFGATTTAALVGSSGAGKSTLINRLAGTQLLPTAAVRSSDSKGRHTTTSRQLIQISNGGILIDTPGMRELQLWTDGELVSSAFPEIEILAARCRFRNCTHLIEDGCAVLQAIARNELAQEQYGNYLKLRREEEYSRSLVDRKLQQNRKDEVKRVHRLYNKIKRKRE